MFNKKNKKSKTRNKAKTGSVIPQASSDGKISPEIIAVITAAVAAMDDSEAGANGLIIRKISRVAGEKIAWNQAGLMECVDSRRF